MTISHVIFRLIFKGVNAQFYDDSTKSLRVINLICREVKERHFADNIKKWFQSSMDLFEIKDEQIFGMAIDSAANITKAVDDLILMMHEKMMNLLSEEENDLSLEDEEETIEKLHKKLEETEQLDTVPYILDASAVRISCVVHKLQLAVNEFMWKDIKVSKILGKAMKLSAKLRTPIVRLKMDIENVKCAVMNQVTRWNSTFFMLKRLLELKDFCLQFQEEKGLEDLKVKLELWEQFSELVEVLKVVADLTTQLQAEELLVPDFIYYWFNMKMKLDRHQSSFAALLKKCINERETVIVKNKIVLAGWYLDKNLNVLMSPEQLGEAKAVVRMISKKKTSFLNDPNIIQQEDTVEPSFETDESDSETFDKFLKAKGKENTGNVSFTKKKQSLSELDKEMAEYDKMTVPRKRPSLILWWNELTEEYPHLSNVALDIISAPVTEVTVERLFSHLKIILSKHRSRLVGDLLEDILFLRLNKQFESKM